MMSPLLSSGIINCKFVVNFLCKLLLLFDYKSADKDFWRHSACDDDVSAVAEMCKLNFKTSADKSSVIAGNAAWIETPLPRSSIVIEALRLISR